MEHPHVKRYIHRRITGSESLDWLTWVLRTHCPAPIGRAYSLGCGPGNLEQHALACGAVERFEACDVSAGAIEQAKAAAAAQGILDRVDYRVEDINGLTLAPAAYDVVFAAMSAHHFTALEHIFGEVRRALRPGGRFILNEYIGPTRFQYPPYVVQLINRLLAILPVRYRRIIVDGAATDEIKQSYQLLPLDHFAQHDPSEAIRSGDILPLLKEQFRIVDYRPYGGSLLTFLLENIAGNFDDEDEDDRAWLAMVEDVELLLEECGRIEASFAVIVAAGDE